MLGVTKVRGLEKIRPRRLRAPLSRSEIMSRIRSSDTSPERSVRSALHRAGIRFRKNARELPGKPDIANQSKRWAIFIHGCFWHAHQNCRLASSPKTNKKYWRSKLSKNVARDEEMQNHLRGMGYEVFVVWECETRDPEALCNRIAQISSVLQSRSRLKKEW
ncbi:MAG TPA: very short patch repair endonuclease [Hyphomicrobium sp.]|nr:very short patch repair endonuclease [Hyphomicrobium sp.]